jgi:hypothetical protein
MNNLFISVYRCIIFFLVLCSAVSCRKEHLQANPTTPETKPLIFIEAKLDGDSVYFAGGVNNYVGIPSMTDTITNFRIFNFSLQNSQLPSQSYFKISINNYKNIPGSPQTDLDSSIFPGNRSYMFPGVIFIPLYVQVYWVDATGVQFKSTSLIPNNFSITDVKDTVVDAKDYKKTKIEFECFLQNNSGGSIHLTNGNAVVVFSVE